MARVGFKKEWAAGTFGAVELMGLFNNIKTYVSNAGFNVLVNSTYAIDFIRAGSPSGTMDDDIPHWALTYGSGDITAYAVYGNNYADANALYTDVYLGGLSDFNSARGRVRAWFAADGIEGWWWLYVIEDDSRSAIGFYPRIAGVGTRSRRYAADMYKGFCSRYGVLTDWSWFPAYCANYLSGAKEGFCRTGVFSVLGGTGIRHPGSPLPRMAAQIFPYPEASQSAAVRGELMDVMDITDGYSLEEQVMPGWIAMNIVPGTYYERYALPAPATFDVL